MKKINLRIKDLRKAERITQQQLADAVGVTFQTVSKWETGVAMPDLSVIPELAEMFRVSVDQLLGLAPLEQEKYVKDESGTSAFWEKRMNYLIRTRKNYWNLDYLDFLIHQVWEISRPIEILDCGCGFGAAGMLLLPLLPAGSRYTGVDFAETLVEQGKKLFAREGLNGRFIRKDFYEYLSREQYDMVISQAVLRHLDTPELFLNKMIGATKDGGMVVCIEPNREFEADGLYIDGMDYKELCKHEALSKKWEYELKQQGRDYAFAMRAGHLMRKAGLQDIQVRMNDKVEFSIPEQGKYRQNREDFLKARGWDQPEDSDSQEKVIQRLMACRASRREGEMYCAREEGVREFFRENPRAAYTCFKGDMITFGWKRAVKKA